MKALGYYLTVFGGVLSHPGAFIAAIAFTIAWVIVQPESFDWHGGVTIATLFMTLFIHGPLIVILRRCMPRSTSSSAQVR